MIIVLSILALVALLAGATVSESQLAATQTKVQLDREEAAWLAESAVARAQWLLMNDIAQNSDRALTTPAAPGRIRADGALHRLDSGEEDGPRIELRVTDFCSGLDLDVRSENSVVAVSDAERLDPDKRATTDTFASQVRDYVDGDDFLTPGGGMERDDYARDGMTPLPRNAPFQYREELLWIPGAAQAFPLGEDGDWPDIRRVPPQGVAKPRSDTLPSFFTASPALLQKRMGLEEKTLQELLEARRRFIEEGVPLEDTTDLGLLPNVARFFSFSESGFYTVTVTARAAAGLPARTLSVSFRQNATPPRNWNQYHDWQWR